MIKIKRKKKKLPKKILAIKNADKTFHESWSEPYDRDEINFPSPFRMIIAGMPNCGKSTIVKNIVLRAYPEYKRVIVIHFDKETLEYDDIGAEVYDKVPHPNNKEFFNRKVKTLLILEDIEYDFMSRKDKKKLDRSFGYLSTHKFVNIISCVQNITSIPVSLRRMSNIFILFRMPDMELLHRMSKRLGVDREVFDYIFKNYILNIHDSFWIDLTHKSPMKYRINGYEPIIINGKILK